MDTLYAATSYGAGRPSVGTSYGRCPDARERRRQEWGAAPHPSQRGNCALEGVYRRLWASSGMGVRGSLHDEHR
jgi:hypothetical protein